jgi:RNA polymerase sigma-70 factor (ECF subfamily)
MSPPNDWQLERYRPLLRVLARRCKLDPAVRVRFDESDLVHEALLRAHAHLHQFTGPPEARVAWLKQILTRTFLDLLDRELNQKRDPARERSFRTAVSQSSAKLDDFLIDHLSSPSQQAERHEWSLKMAAAIEQLPPPQRDAVIQRYLEESPVVAIAERMQRTEKSVSGLLRRGLATLRQLLEDHQP